MALSNYCEIRMHNGTIYGVKVAPYANETWAEIASRAEAILRGSGVSEEVDHAHGVTGFDDGSEEVVHILFNEQYEVVGNSMMWDKVDPNDFLEISFDICHD